jgi:hypothetical protein
VERDDRMMVEEAQRDVRQQFVGGFFGQLVAGIIWTASAAFASWGTHQAAITVLIVGGFFIFPLTVALLRLSGRSGALSQGNPMGPLAMQVAFVLPLSLPLVGAATMCRVNWFYPAFMVALGAHYLPFSFLYGMRMFGVLAAVLISAGLWLGLYGPSTFSLGAWMTAGTLLVFAFLGGGVARAERARSAA